jgi:hypothetical protein
MTQTTRVESLVRHKIEFYRDFKTCEQMIVNLFDKTDQESYFLRERYYPVSQIVFDSAGQGFILQFKGLSDAVGGVVGTPKERRIPLARFEIVPYGADCLEVKINHISDGTYSLVIRSCDLHEDSTQE